MPGTLGVEQEQRPKDPRERRSLELGPNLVVGDVAAARCGPASKLSPQAWHHVLAQ